MSIVFFNSVLTMLGKRVNYDAVVNYAGNSFAKDAWKTIRDANPLGVKEKKHAFADMFAEVAIPQAKVIPTEANRRTDILEAANSNFGDVTGTDVADMFEALHASITRT